MIIPAIYENGGFRPLGPVDLAEREVVSLTVQAAPSQLAESNGQQPTLFELFDEAGLIDCVKDAPPDQSSNPRHLEGFGNSGD